MTAAVNFCSIWFWKIILKILVHRGMGQFDRRFGDET